MTKPPVGSEIDTRELRDVLGAFPTGVTVVSCPGIDGSARGMTANSFNSISLDPAVVAWNIAHTAPSYPHFAAAQHFSFSILAGNQLEPCMQFARPAEDKFAGISIEHDDNGVPVIVDCAAWIQCRKSGSFEVGDHTIILGQVERLQDNGHAPLFFAKGNFGEAPT